MVTTYPKERAPVRFLRRVIPTMLPKDGKRAVFLTTLFMKIAKISPSHQQSIKELNHRLHLVDNDAALNFPMSLRDTVWGGQPLNIRQRRDDEAMPTDYEIEGMARRIISHGGRWSRYGNYDQVLDETKEVIRSSLAYQIAS